jgi:hypothetical protein
MRSLIRGRYNAGSLRYRSQGGKAGNFGVGREGLSVVLIRPKAVWPFPTICFENTAKAYLVAELNAGQMIEDVKLAVNGRAPVYFINRMGGHMLTVEDIVSKAILLAGGVVSAVQFKKPMPWRILICTTARVVLT